MTIEAARPRRRWRIGDRQMQALGATLVAASAGLLGVWHDAWSAAPGLAVLALGVIFGLVGVFMAPSTGSEAEPTPPRRRWLPRPPTRKELNDALTETEARVRRSGADSARRDV